MELLSKFCRFITLIGYLYTNTYICIDVYINIGVYMSVFTFDKIFSSIFMHVHNVNATVCCEFPFLFSSLILTPLIFLVYLVLSLALFTLCPRCLMLKHWKSIYFIYILRYKIVSGRVNIFFTR